MAQIEYRANLSSSDFPLTLARSGRTVINPQADQNYDKRVDKDGNDKGSVGIPQAIYLENVIPNASGYQSVGYSTEDNLGFTGTINTIEQIQLAVTTESSVTETEVTWTDDGTNLGSWSTNTNPYNFFSLVNGGIWPDPNAEMTGFSSYVGETTTPHTGYEMRNLIVGSAVINMSTLPTATYILRALPSSTFTESVISFDIFFTASPGAIAEGLDDYFTQRQFKAATHCTAARAGVFLEYDSNGSVFRLYLSAGQIAGGTYAALSLDTHYTVTITTTKVTGGFHQISATIHDGVTLVMSVAGLFTVGSDTGAYMYVETTKDNPTATYTTTSTGQSAVTVDGTWPIDATYIYTTISTIVDAFDVTITRPATEYTITSGLSTVEIAFTADDTVNFDVGTEAILPGGFVSPADTNGFSTANVLGTCYVCIRNAGVTNLYTVAYDVGDLVFTDVTADIASFSSLYSANDIIGICGAFNYLLLFTSSVVFWSSTTTPLDFSASLVTGAGSETPNGLAGDITFAKPHVAGFYIYTTNNVIFAAYTGNSRYPWKFREISGSSGFTYSSQVSGNTNSEFHVGLTNTKNIQFLYPDQAKLEAPALADFLGRTKVIDVWNDNTRVFDTVVLEDSLGNDEWYFFNNTAPRLWFFHDRYIIVPYYYYGDGDVTPTAYNYKLAIVYDTLLRRYGKLRKDFAHMFANTTDMVVVADTGEAHSLSLDPGEERFVDEVGVVSPHSGKLLLGKFQLARGLMTQLEGVEIESAQSGSISHDDPVYTGNFNVAVLPSLDGKNFTATQELTRKEVGIEELATYNCHITAKSVSVLIEGAFDVNTVVLTLVPAGKA
jgi:hypothetical protein